MGFNRGALDRRAFDKGTTDGRVSQGLPVDLYPVLDAIINQSVKITNFLCSAEYWSHFDISKGLPHGLIT